ncbi:MAG: DNA polymerase III subunit beta [Candidatus Andersenbacteria bacterium]
MKFICTKENLVEGLSKVVPLAGRNTQLPILQNILLQLRDGVLHLTSTDLEIGIHTVVPGKIEDEGSCTVVARKFMEYIQQLPPLNPLKIELKERLMNVSTTGFNAQFPTTADDDFPLLPRATSSREITLKANKFCQGLNRTIFAAARDDTRPEIHSVYTTGEGERIYIAATDSFRLAEEVMGLEEEIESFSFLLPLTTAQEVVRLFTNQEIITLLPHDNYIAFHGDGIELSSRLIDGKYPDYRQIIPTNFTTTGTLNRQDLVRALKTLAVFLPRDSRRVQMVVQPQAGKIKLAVGGSESGAGTVDLDFTGEGETLEILFNIQYLLDGVQYIPGEECVVKFVSAVDPAMFSPVPNSTVYTYVVMPIQV